MAEGPDILKGPEPGLYYVRGSESRKTESWQVGDRYVLEKVLGEGSFSCVCLATDQETQEKVAVKRVGDVLASIDNAKRVLRECAILRRLSHPNIVGLRDLFTRPASTGRLVYRGGKLVPTSIDLYMVLEYCDQGDLFHMRGQLFETDVQFIMWQLLEVLRYIHACDVWHRDIKSANILISLQEGRRVAKLCDFGSARSASQLSSNGSDLGMLHCVGPSTAGAAQAGAWTDMCQPAMCGGMTRPNSGVNHSETDVMARMAQEQEQQRRQLELTDRAVSARLRSSMGGAQPPAEQLQQQQQGGPQPMECGGGPSECGAGPGLQGPGAPASPPASVPGQSGQHRWTTSPGRHSISAMLQQQQDAARASSLDQPLDPPAQRQVNTLLDADVSPPANLTAAAAAYAAANGVQLSDLYARPSMKARGGYDQPLTRAVCTPCYRAPEVVMSHGQYSSALDMWSLGCVFGELLQRVSYPGKSATPHLQVAPVIALLGMPLTPKVGERFDGPGNETTCKELAALFSVVGTPAWGTIDHVVQHPAWHAYLRQTPGRPSQLYRRFAQSGDGAVDLLSRLLEFDPGRRATAEEAQQHAYFDALKQLLQVWMVEEAEEAQEDLQSLLMMVSDDAQATPHTPTLAGGLASSPLGARWVSPSIQSAGALLSGATGPASPLSPTVSEGLGFDTWWRDASMDPQHVHCVARVLAGLEVELTNVCGGTVTTGGAAPSAGGAAATCSSSSSAVVQQRLREMLEAECEEHQRAMAEMMRQVKEAWAGPAGMPASGSSGGLSDMEVIAPQAMQQPGSAPSTAPPALAAAADAPPRGARSATVSASVSPRFPSLTLTHTPNAMLGEVGQLPQAFAAGASGLRDVMMGSAGGAAGVPSQLQLQARRQLLAGKWGRGAYGYMYRRLGINRKQWALQPDPAASSEDPSDIGKERMGHHRDAEQAGLLPEQHLRAGRHQEWVPTSLVDSLRSAGGADPHSWGVSLAPPGMNEAQMAPGMMDAIRIQHAR